jgi:hypothetical protein
MFGAHEERGLIRAHAPLSKDYLLLQGSFSIYKARHIRLSESKEKNIGALCQSQTLTLP